MNNEDAVTVLQVGQQSLCRLFEQYRVLMRAQATPARRKALAEQICLQVNIQTRLEDELLYPLLREGRLVRPEQLASGSAEHANAGELMGTLLLMNADEPGFDTHVGVLADYMEQHMQGESSSLLPQLRTSGLDTALLGRRLRERRRELEAVPEALREQALVAMLA